MGVESGGPGCKGRRSIHMATSWLAFTEMG